MLPFGLFATRGHHRPTHGRIHCSVRQMVSAVSPPPPTPSIVFSFVLLEGWTLGNTYGDYYNCRCSRVAGTSVPLHLSGTWTHSPQPIPGPSTPAGWKPTAHAHPRGFCIGWHDTPGPGAAGRDPSPCPQGSRLHSGLLHSGLLPSGLP